MNVHGDGVAVRFAATGMFVSSVDGGRLRASTRSQAHCSPAEQSSRTRVIKSGRRAWQPAVIIGTSSKTPRNTTPTCRMCPASGDHQRIDSPSSGNHGVLEVSYEPPRGIHSAGARPRSSGEMSGKDVEKRIFLDGFQPAISRCIGIVGVEGPNQLGVFLDDDPQCKIRGGVM
jgi:hypothetical protein